MMKWLWKPYEVANTEERVIAWECPACGEVAEARHNYCPHCGKPMKTDSATSFTNKELAIFASGISLKLLSLRSAQHWEFDERTAEEIEFLEILYDKVKGAMQ